MVRPSVLSVEVIVDDVLDGRGGVLGHECHGAFDAFALGDLVDERADGVLVGKGHRHATSIAGRGSSWGGVA